MPDSQPQPDPKPQSAGGDALLRRQNLDLDAEVMAISRRNEELEFECGMWRERLERARLKIEDLENGGTGSLKAPKKFFPWLLYEIRRTQARFGRSVKKRIFKLRNAARKMAGKEPLTLPLNPSPRPPAFSRYRHSMERASEFTAESFLRGPSENARDPQRPAPSNDVAVYYNTSGNYFFQEIALLIHAALVQAGFRASLHTDEHGRAADANFHLVVAPHEFFPLGRGAWCFGKGIRDRLLLLNTEQPHTQWYKLASTMFPHARHIFDMDQETAAAMKSSGLPASHLPLGFVENFTPYASDRDLLPGPETEALGIDVRRWRDTGRPLAERPIALSFVGEATPRRSAFFMKAAPLLERHECHLRLMPRGSGPWTAGRSRVHSRTLTTVGLSQRSRIVFNVHRDKEHYFEWHRIVLMGIWQRALVLTETATQTTPFVPGEDYVQAPFEDLPKLIDYYLRDPQGIAEAEHIRNSGHERLRSHCSLPGLMKDFITPLVAENR